MSEAEPDVKDEGNDGDLTFSSDGPRPPRSKPSQHPSLVEPVSTGPVLSRELLSSILVEYAEEIKAVERELADELPVGPPQEVHQSLNLASDALRSGKRTMRALPALNVYNRVTDIQFDKGLTEMLVALDAKVNAIDDIVDTPELGWERKVHLMVITAMSDVLAVKHLPPQHVSEVAGILRQYWTELAQIPIVEKRLRERIQTAGTPQERLEATTSIYEFRARDIKAFAQIPAVNAQLTDTEVERIEGDLRAYRARHLLFEDFRHVERDVSLGHESPIIVLAGTHPASGRLTDIVHELLERFRYSELSEGSYAELLRHLERRPSDIDKQVAICLQSLDF